MKVSRERVAENRRKILDAASRLFRERGFGSVSVAEVMEAAGLTHGGFYGHFKSKDDLIAHALAHALEQATPDDPDLPRFIASYLSSQHCQNLAEGCAVAALGVETARQGPEARAAMTAGLRKQLGFFTEHTAGKTAAERRRAAIGTSAAMLGALILARLSDDPHLSDEILAQTRKWLGAKVDQSE
jgi:TetR/AcrR family transcriptional regulator, transcriptional repressor for nem operon